jgi:hypothetical protein
VPSVAEEVEFLGDVGGVGAERSEHEVEVAVLLLLSGWLGWLVEWVGGV